MTALILSHNGKSPRIHSDAFIAENAVIIGDVEIAAGASVWYGCILRGDVNRIVVGEDTNIQDGTVVHVDDARDDLPGGLPTLIGAKITIGHMALLHACILEDGCFVGMRATVMDAAVIESGAMVAAGALVTPNKRVPKGELWAGSPAKLMRELSEGEREMMVDSPARYAGYAQAYLQRQHDQLTKRISEAGRLRRSARRRGRQDP
ncbi:MAG: gamma carbonic anhydrase family protein [Rhodovibrionaceae bacterium]